MEGATDEFFIDYPHAVRAADEHIKRGMLSEVIPRLRVGQVIYCVRTRAPKKVENTDENPIP